MVISASSHHQAIQDAVGATVANNEDYENVKYSVSDGYYPDEWEHEIDLSEVPEDRLMGSSVSVVSELARRGMAVNSVRCDPLRLHVIGLDWFEDRAEGGER